MGEGFVTEKECKLINDNLKEKIEGNEKSLEDNNESIKELTNISAKLTWIVEQQGKTLDEHSKQIRDLQKTKPWYETEIGKYIVKALIWLLFIIVASAIGMNAMDTLKTIQSIKP